MKKRTFLQLGLASAAVLALAGGAAALIQPGLEAGRLSPPARGVLSRVAEALLAGSLPTEPAARQAALQALLQRVDRFIATLPEPTQAELGQLFSLLSSAAGRWGLAGLAVPWDAATAADISEALQSMRLSGIALRQQAYLGLHDIVCAPYFSGEDAWTVLGYPGPLAL